MRKLTLASLIFLNSMGVKADPPSFVYHGRFQPIESAARAMTATPCELGELTAGASSPPNSNDDPGTTDPRCFEINFTDALDFGKNPDGSSITFNDFQIDSNYGIREGTQGKIVLHLENLNGYPGASVPGDVVQAINQKYVQVEMGVKQVLVNSDVHQLEVSVFPTLVAGSSNAPSGNTLVLPVLVAKGIGPFVVTNNLGVVIPLGGSQQSSKAQIVMGTAASVKVGQNSLATFEVYRTADTNLVDEALTQIGLSFATKLTEHLLMYGSIGKSIGSTSDGAKHLYALGGLKVQFGKGESSPALIDFSRRQEP